MSDLRAGVEELEAEMRQWLFADVPSAALVKAWADRLAALLAREPK